MCISWGAHHVRFELFQGFVFYCFVFQTDSILCWNSAPSVTKFPSIQSMIHQVVEAWRSRRHVLNRPTYRVRVRSNGIYGRINSETNHLCSVLFPAYLLAEWICEWKFDLSNFIFSPGIASDSLTWTFLYVSRTAWIEMFFPRDETRKTLKTSAHRLLNFTEIFRLAICQRRNWIVAILPSGAGLYLFVTLVKTWTNADILELHSHVRDVLGQTRAVFYVQILRIHKSKFWDKASSMSLSYI